MVLSKFATAKIYIVTILFISVFLASLEHVYPELGFSMLFAVSPALVALIFAYFDRERPLTELGWHPKFNYWVKILALVMAMVAALLFIAFCLGHTELNDKALNKFLRLSTLFELCLGILVNTGEELGWRGYLFPKLYKRLGWWKTIFVSTFVWWIWHVPFMASLQFKQFGSIQWETQAIQLLSLFPVTVLFSYWFLESNSFWAIGFAHQLGNFVNKWFLGLEHSKKTPVFFADQSFAHLYSLENGTIGFVILLVTAFTVYTLRIRKKW